MTNQTSSGYDSPEFRATFDKNFSNIMRFVRAAMIISCYSRIPSGEITFQLEESTPGFHHTTILGGLESKLVLGELQLKLMSRERLLVLHAFAEILSDMTRLFEDTTLAIASEVYPSRDAKALFERIQLRKDLLTKTMETESPSSTTTH